MVLLSGKQKNLPIDVLAYSIARSYLSLFTWWLDQGLPYSAGQMDALFRQLVFPGVREILSSSGPL